MTVSALVPQVTVTTNPRESGIKIGHIGDLTVRAAVRSGSHEVTVAGPSDQVVLVETFIVTGTPVRVSRNGWQFSTEAMFLSSAAITSLFTDVEPSAVHDGTDDGPCSAMLNLTPAGWDVWHRDPQTPGLVIRTRTVLDRSVLDAQPGDV